MNTKSTELFGIKYPIVQGGMAWVSDANLTAAVSNAGGLGTISSAGRTVEWGSVQAGQSLSVITSIKSCQEIVESIMNDAKGAYKKAGSLFE